MSQQFSQELVGRLELVRHPEGGWFEMGIRDDLPDQFPGHSDMIRRLTREP